MDSFIAVSIFATVLAILLIRELYKSKILQDKYSDIINIDKELIKKQIEKEEIQTYTKNLQSKYKDKKDIYDKLIQKVAIYDEEIELAELGFYKPHFDFDSSEKYKKEILEIRAQQKNIINGNIAITCSTEWTVEGSKAKGRTMTNRGIKLTARAFNNECDSAIANVRWNNVERIEQRVKKAFESINKLNKSNHIYISYDYLNLKISELRLTHEYKEKKQQEKEEQAEIKRQMRDEIKLIQEFEQAQKDEDKYIKLLEKTKADIEKATGSQLENLNKNIKKLQQDLNEANIKNKRAKSMAEQTKSGHVYIVSNVGSFGENIYKIGMTRRLEPLDRIKELSGASVPFVFDIHAMIYSNNAPELEKNLHQLFNSKRVNLVNLRKEFFNISLDEIEKEVKKLHSDVVFIKTIEAQNYKESKSIRMQQNSKLEYLSDIPNII